ncbi:hypothetical protein JZ785_23205 [Alicyclobacillus curvatus]|nr:hypothetical protein JZ785_23205 [Alicyclobacillus curvatus]
MLGSDGTNDNSYWSTTDSNGDFTTAFTASDSAGGVAVLAPYWDRLHRPLQR